MVSGHVSTLPVPVPTAGNRPWKAGNPEHHTMTAELHSLADYRSQHTPQALSAQSMAPARRSRRDAWLYAQHLREFAEAKRDLVRSVQSLKHHGLEAPALDTFSKLLSLGHIMNAASIDDRLDTVRAVRQAVAVQIRTPAYNAECVRWKQAQWRRDAAYLHLVAGFTQAEFDRIIAADRVYLEGARRRPKAAAQ